MVAFRTFALTGVLAVAGALALADEAKKEAAKDDKKVDEATFVMKAAAGNMLEMRAGEMAQKSGTSDEVKKFGEMMVKDHGKAQSELLQIAQGKGLKPPADLMPDQKAAAEKLAKMTGKDFDKEYAKAMVESHTKSVDLYESFIKSGKDEALVGFAKKTVPTVKHHLEMAKQLEGKVK